MSSKRTAACAISSDTKRIVEERDGHRCVFCGSNNCRGEAHYIRRSQGGLGIPQNLLCVCRNCHYEMDSGPLKETYREIARKYLKSKYPDWNEDNLVYNKWKDLKYQ